MPLDQFTPELAKSWISETPYPEIAEQCSRYLFEAMPASYAFAGTLFEHSEEKYARLVAFLIFSYGMANGKNPSVEEAALLKYEALRTLTNADTFSWTERHAVVPALRYYGRLSKQHAEEVMDWIAHFEKSDRSDLQEIYNELKFEFEYYQ